MVLELTSSLDFDYQAYAAAYMERLEAAYGALKSRPSEKSRIEVGHG